MPALLYLRDLFVMAAFFGAIYAVVLVTGVALGA